MAAHDELMALDVFDAIDLVLTEGSKVSPGRQRWVDHANDRSTGGELPQPCVRRSTWPWCARV